jgi:hypothetical protein
MPCSLELKNNIPKYIQAILDEILAGNDDALKACACNLKVPVGNDGCPVKDEDGKFGIFPFCCSLVEEGVGDNTNYPLKLTLKQAMDLYWNTSSWNLDAVANSAGCCTYNGIFSGGERYEFNDLEREAPPKKNLVCFNYFNYKAGAQVTACCPVPGNPEPVCSTSSSEPIVLTLFENLDAMRYKKEGNIYYFYPHLTIAIGVYAICAAHTKSAASECLSSYLGGQDNGTATVNVKILGKAAEGPLKLYQKLFVPTNAPGSCGFSGNVGINKLEFI